MSKPTVQQIAARAGVSTATVDRVLHGRMTVSEKTRRKVELAISGLGFSDLPELILKAAQGSLSFKFLVPDRRSGFADQLERALLDASMALDGIEIHCDSQRVSLSNGSEIIAALDMLNPTEHQGVGLFAIDVPGVKQAIGRAVDRGISVVTLVSDIPDSARHYFIGIDNTSAGRVAGNLIGRFIGPRQGSIGVICGSLRLRDQSDRYFGFRQIIESRFPHLTLLRVCEGDSDPELNQAFAQDMLDLPDLQGIYSFAAGNKGILAALNSIGDQKRPIVVMHELSDPVREGLAMETIDAVIAQNTEHIARSAMRVLRAFCQQKPIIPSQERIRIDIYLADNI